MLHLTCQDVSATMPDPLRQRVEALIVQRGGDNIVSVCTYEVTGESIEEVLDRATQHVKEQHALLSWPQEYWVHLKARILPV